VLLLPVWFWPIRLLWGLLATLLRQNDVMPCHYCEVSVATPW
jgi:hypothetical protein